MPEFTPFGEQLDKVNVASQELIRNSNQQADQFIKAGKYQQGTDTMHNMLDGIEAKNKVVNAAKQQNEANVKQILGSASNTSPISSAPKTNQSLLPKGISRGKIAAIAAGIAVVGGGIYLYRQHQQKKQESWAGRIERERALSQQRGLSF